MVGASCILVGNPRVSSPLTWFGSHVESKCAAVLQLAVGKKRIIKTLAVRLDRLDVDVIRRKIVRGHGERLSVREMKRGFLQLRCPDHIVIAAGTNGVEAEAGKDIPGRHLAAVVIPAE